MGLMAIVLFAMIGLAIDVGRVFVTKAELSRDVDAAALSGVLDLPDISQAIARAEDYMAENDPEAVGVAELCEDESGCLQVSGTKSVSMYFLSVLGIGEVEVAAHAKAGFGTQVLDAYMAIDATSSMAGDPIAQAKDAAQTFAEILLGGTGGNTQVGAGAFRGCYDNPRNWTPCANTQDESSPEVFDLTNDIDDLDISAIGTTSGSGTNVCGGLFKAYQVMAASDQLGEENLQRIVVLLSDGDNIYNDNTYALGGEGSPVPECRPSDPTDDNGYTSGGCDSDGHQSDNPALELDVLTWELAKAMEDDGIEIYVVGFGVCDPEAWPGAPYYTDAQCDAQIGDSGSSNHDDIADERLLKCIASSSAGTNDHYFWAEDADDLPAIFSTIAFQIGHRLIE
jgi:hypothetical protein